MKPLLMIKLDQAMSFEKAIKDTAFYKKAKPKTKAKKATKKKTKKVVKQGQIVEPVRESPFAKGDVVWSLMGSQGYIKTTILKTIKPGSKDRAWSYLLGNGKTVTEESLLPNQIFSLIATDAKKLVDAKFITQLNEVFDAPNVRVLAVYRTGQSRPWAYYVIPDTNRLYKLVEWKFKEYSYESKGAAELWKGPIKDMSVTFLPISSAPQEILTYLGNKIYNRKWINE